jgi:hypothetical protein
MRTPLDCGLSLRAQGFSYPLTVAEKSPASQRKDALLRCFLIDQVLPLFAAQ